MEHNKPAKIETAALTLRKQSPSLECLLAAKWETAQQIAFIQAQGLLTVKKALTTPQLSKLKKEAPADLSEGLTRLIGFYNSQFNLDPSKRLGAVQVALLVQDIMNRYWRLKFDEIVYILREGVTGKYGKLYGAFDAMVIHGWFDAYITGERDELIERQAYDNHIKHKEGAKEVLDPETLQAFYSRSKSFIPQPDIRAPLGKNPLSEYEAFKIRCQGLEVGELARLMEEARELNPAMTIIIQEVINLKQSKAA